MRFKTAILCGMLVSFSLLWGCGDAVNQENTVLNPDDYDWAKRTNFKQDFKDEFSQIEALTIADASLVQMILDAVEKGNAKAYSYGDNKLLSENDVKNVFLPVDTVSVFDLDSGKELEQVRQFELNRKAVQKMRVKQEWYFDKDAFTMTSRVLAVAPLETIFNADGSERGDAPIFWVYFN